nr:hypothetical protein [Tanacetum cinerariifolium]
MILENVNNNVGELVAASEPLGLGYRALRCHELAVRKDQAPSTFEVGQSSRVYTNILAYVLLAAPVQTPPSPEWSLSFSPVSPSSLVVSSPIASPMATPTAIISVDEDEFIEDNTYDCVCLTRMSPSHSVRVAEVMALSNSAFCKRYRSYYETPSPSSSPTLQVRKRYEEEEAVPEGQQQALLIVGIAASEPLGLGYRALRCHELAVRKDQAPSTFEVGQSSRVYTNILAYVLLAAPVQTPPSPDWSLSFSPVSPSSLVVSSPIASPVATLTAIISVDEDEFIEVEAQLKLHGSILHNHT